MEFAPVQYRRPRRKMHRSTRFMLFGLACAAIVSPLWIFVPRLLRDAGVKVPVPKIVDAERAAVHTWLGENLDDPEWQEVRWWQARPLEAFKEERLNKIGDDVEFFRQNGDQANLQQAAAKLDAAKLTPAPLACRIKFRAKNVFGAYQLQDRVFFIEDGQAVRGKVPGRYDDHDEYLARFFEE